MKLKTTPSRTRIWRAAPVLGAIALTLLVVAQAAAHDTWLMGAGDSGRVGTAFQLDLTSGETFANDDFAIEAGRVLHAVVRERGVARPLPVPSATARTLRYMWTPTSPGVATIGIELRPRTLELEPRLIDAYLAEINADSGVRAAWKALGGKEKWTESYSKHAMTFVRVGATHCSCGYCGTDCPSLGFPSVP